VIGEHRDERIASDRRDMAKPSMHDAVDAEGLLQTLQQYVVIDDVEDCH